MKKIISLLLPVFILMLSACDLQPKILSIPDNVGEFISTRYPALLADPDVQPEIYNSAATDYGVYASPELYGNGTMDDYLLYANIQDYTLQPTSVSSVYGSTAFAPPGGKIIASPMVAIPDDYLNIPEHKSRAGAAYTMAAPGDTLYSISRQHSVTIDELARINNLSAPYRLSVGQKIMLVQIEPDIVAIPASAVAPIAGPELITTEITVGRGETLYSLSRAHSMTVSELAKLNNLSSPYALTVGQKLKVTKSPVIIPLAPTIVTTPTMTPPIGVIPAVKTTKVDLIHIKVTSGETLYSISRTYSIPVNDLAVLNKLSPPFALTVGQRIKVPKATEITKIITPAPPVNITKVIPTVSAPKVVTTTKTPEKISSDPTKALPAITKRSSSKFTQPVRGTLISGFGTKSGGLHNDGINIGAKSGTSVSAAENGVVAYAGNEIKGMGNVVIVQHSDGWMTVYAHMDKMTVRRGARVNVGHQVGTVGQTGRVDKPQLHFEIRKGTKAYDPSSYLKK